MENIKSKIRQLEDETIAKVCRQQNQVQDLQKDQLVSQVTQSAALKLLTSFERSRSVQINMSLVSKLVHYF